MDRTSLFKLSTAFCLGAAVHRLYTRQSKAVNDKDVLQVALAFLHAQTLRDLDEMCSLAHKDIVYINEPHPPERTIRGRDMFREVFAQSPCIWCPDAKLEVLQSVCQGDTVFVERLDQFLVDGHWIKIPICGYLKVLNGKVVLWKDYWCYKKYKEFVVEHYGSDFKLFKKTAISD